MLKLWELAPSPNNVKVRMALRFKGIEFESVPVDPADRSTVREVTGQDLTPAIEDRGIVLTDSEAILQYLDANEPDAPRLFPRDRKGRHACDGWKRNVDRELARPWLPVFLHAIGRREDLDTAARQAFQDALALMDQAIGDDLSFHDDPDMAVCDLRVAEWAVYALPGPGLIERCGLFKRFAQLYGVEPGTLPSLERFLAPWNERLA